MAAPSAARTAAQAAGSGKSTAGARLALSIAAALLGGCSGAGFGYGATCVADADCGGRTPTCNAFGYCVECETGTDCGSGVCGADGLCKQCDSDDDCDPGAPLCNPHLGRCVECLASGHCPLARPVCMPYGACVTQCTSSGACPVGICGAYGGCAGCDTDFDCPSIVPRCDPVLLSCRSCAHDADCGVAAPFCVDGVCQQCVQNTNCGASMRCNPALVCEAE